GLGAGFELDPPPRVDRGELVPVAAAELLRVAPLDLLDSCQPRSGRALAGRLDRAGEQEPPGQGELVDPLAPDGSGIRGWRVVAGGGCSGGWGCGGIRNPWGAFRARPATWCACRTFGTLRGTAVRGALREPSPGVGMGRPPR